MGVGRLRASNSVRTDYRLLIRDDQEATADYPITDYLVTDHQLQVSYRRTIPAFIYLWMLAGIAYLLYNQAQPL